MSSRYRPLVTPLALIAAAILIYMENPWFFPAPGSTAGSVAAVAFWVLSIAVVVLMFGDRKSPDAELVEVEGPAFTRYLFSNTRAGLFWLPIRIFLGFEWLVAGYHKLVGQGWTDGGSAVLGYWQHAVSIPDKGAAPITFDWYRSFLQILIDSGAQGWFAWLIVLGELLVGLALLTGVLVGFAAFAGIVMNMSYLLAGSTSVNPIMFALAIGLILGWRVAGYYGLDRYLMPRLGVPWKAKVAAASRS
jgi:thiosulfate dehydrogenase [quinone] large subunit